MADLTRYQSQGLLTVDPQARGLNISIRLATRSDFPFIDALQKSESEGLGFLCDQAWYKRIEEGNVLVAEAAGSQATGQMTDGGCGMADGETRTASAGSTIRQPQSDIHPRLVGYCMGVDRYQKRSELGIIYQMAVAPEYRRCNVAAALLQAQFDKSAYGTRLYCCWCKQSLAANRFWEAMGFVPLAFRAGRRARTKKQAEEPVVHIFWQKPVRAADIEDARQGNFRGWWYPYETQGGSMMEGRVVLPLPPEVSWDEAVPVVLPGQAEREAEQLLLQAKVDEIAKEEKAVRKGKAKAGKAGNAKTPTPGCRQDAKGKQGKTSGRTSGGRLVMGFGFGAGTGFGNPVEQDAAADVSVEAGPSVDEQEVERLKAEKLAGKVALKQAQRRNDPQVVAYARELRDRWQEQVSPGSAFAGMIEARLAGKYAVGRMLAPGSYTGGAADEVDIVEERKRLEAA